MAEYEPVLRTAELGPGAMREVEVHGEQLVVLNVGQTYYALDAHCPDEGANLARDGRLTEETLICPKDHTAFDFRTGERRDGEDGPGLRRYGIRVEGNLIKVGPALDD